MFFFFLMNLFFNWQLNVRVKWIKIRGVFKGFFEGLLGNCFVTNQLSDEEFEEVGILCLFIRI